MDKPRIVLPDPKPRPVAQVGPLMAAGLPEAVAERVLEVLDRANHPAIADNGSGTRKW
jgi:hypothetical protein